MWRISTLNNVVAQPVFSEHLNEGRRRGVIAYPLNGDIDEDLVQADAQINNDFLAKASYDLASDDQQLKEIYADIKNDVFPLYANDTLVLLKKYPNLDVNVKATFSNYTLLHKAVCQSTPRVAKALIHHPTMKISTLESCLNFINDKISINKTQKQIKQYIEDALSKKLQLGLNSSDMLDSGDAKVLFIRATRDRNYESALQLMNAQNLSLDDYSECIYYVMNSESKSEDKDKLLAYMLENMHV